MQGQLIWTRRTVHDEYVEESHNGRFKLMWAGRHPTKPQACYDLWDAVQRKHFRGFLNTGNAMRLAECFVADNVYKVGLVACCGEKLPHKDKARNLYQSDLFKKASAYAEKMYHEWFILSAKYGLVHPDDMIEPYDQTLKRMNADATLRWGYLVQEQLAERPKSGTVREPSGRNALLYYALFFMHAGADYCEPLEQYVPMDYPMKGMGIGKQLAFYKQALETSGAA